MPSSDSNESSCKRTAVVIPYYNETLLFEKFYRSAVEAFESMASIAGQAMAFDLVVVDDGSREPLDLKILEDGAGANLARTRIHLLRHLQNLGQGAALRTGITFGLRKLGSDYFVTMDSDGQHRLEDLPAVLSPVVTGTTDITFGNRFRGALSKNMPKSRRIILKAAAAFERMTTGLPLNDAHNGYRGFNRKTAELLKLRQNRMAHATEIKQIVARNGLRFVEVPVTIYYSADTLAKGQSNIGSFNILKDLLKSYLFES
jgi:glycosyltransferase involved in cell wall biosynthesis